MKKIRSLLFREFKIARKNYILSGVLIFSIMIFITLGILLLISSGNDELTKYMQKSMFNMLVLMSSFMAPSIYLTDVVFKADINSGWMKYSYGLPVTSFERAVVRTIRIVGMMFFAIALSQIFIAVICMITCRPFQLWFSVIHFTMMGFSLLLGIISNLFTLSARSIEELKKKTAYSEILITSLTFVFMFLSIKFFKRIDFTVSEEEQLKELVNVLNNLLEKMNGVFLIAVLILMVLLITVLFALNYFNLRSAYNLKSDRKSEKIKKSEKVEVLSDTNDYPIGWLYKELKQNRLTIVFTALVPLIVFIVILVMFSLMYIIKKESLEVVKITAIRLGVIALSWFIVSNLITNVFTGDDKKLIAYFTHTTPNGVKKYMYHKFILYFALDGLLLFSLYIIDSFISTMGYVFKGEEADSLINVFVFIFYFIIFSSCFDIPLAVRFGATKSGIIKVILLVIISILVVLVGFMIPDEIRNKIFDKIYATFKGESDVGVIIMSIFPFIALTGYFISYKFSCKLFMKGVKEYDK